MLKEAKLNLALQLRDELHLHESNQLLIKLAEEYPQNAYIHYQCAWSFDRLGEEAKAVPYYEKAIHGDLAEEDLQNAYLGLGSTFRALGEYEKSRAVLVKAIEAFPNNEALRVFYAMTLYNLKEYQSAMELVLKCIVSTSDVKEIQKYKKAIEFYSDKLDEAWK
jgi:tetratricopeptide (TPR) repeat protein